MTMLIAESPPPTPLHPAGNQEVGALPTLAMPSNNLDLNPDLYDDDDDDDDNYVTVDNDNDNDDTRFNDNDNDNDNNNDNDDNESDVSLEDVNIKDLKTFTIPFDTAFELVQLEFEEHNDNQIKTNESQQSKFVNYLDNSLLKVQRKFIKHIAGLENDKINYSIFNLTNELNDIINLIWFSVNKQNKLFGQVNYLIKIMLDLEDYVGHYEFTNLIEINDKTDEIITNQNNINLIKYFNLLQSLDVKISFLIDGYKLQDTDNSVQRINNTELIRLNPITSRLRILVISKLDPIRYSLSKILNNTNSSKLSKQRANDLLNLLEVEASRLFEGILDRI